MGYEPMTAEAAGTARRSPVLSILLGGLAAGTGDSILACVLYPVSLTRIYQSVASGLIGRAAFSGGLTTASLGMLLHFTIATIWAAVFVGASRVLPLLVRWSVPVGLAYGCVVYLLMKYVVVPLSNVPRLGRFEPWAIVGHAFLVGLPIVLLARWGAPRSLRG
jgi:hypothetical protein